MAAGSLADAFISGHSAYYLAIATAFLTGEIFIFVSNNN